VKRSGRDEPMWIVTHKCTETMLEISLYLKLEKTLCFLVIFYVFSSTKLENKREKQVLTRSGGGDMAQIVCTHVINIKMIK
jgi:hypothetical protein